MTDFPYPWQQKQWQTCLRNITGNSMPHAVLLYGEEGLGINTFAGKLINALLCRDSNERPCGVCNACHLWLSHNHPDYLHIAPVDNKKDIKISTIREAIHFLQIVSHYKQGKTLLIQQADAMNRSAANSILKTLEEPPANSTIILTTRWLSKLLPTIRSRCQILRFSSPSAEINLQWLSARTGLNTDEIKAQSEVLSEKPLIALEILQTQVKDTEGKPEFYKDLNAISAGGNIISTAEKWAKLPHWEVHKWLLEIITQTIRNNVLDISSISTSAPSLRKLYAFYDRQVKRYQLGTGNLNPQLLLETAFLEWKIIHTTADPRRKK